MCVARARLHVRTVDARAAVQVPPEEAFFLFGGSQLFDRSCRGAAVFIEWVVGYMMITIQTYVRILGLSVYFSFLLCVSIRKARITTAWHFGVQEHAALND